MKTKFNINYTCDISNVSETVLKRISVMLWTSDRKLLLNKLNKDGNNMIITVNKIFDSTGALNPSAQIEICKKFFMFFYCI